MKAFKKKLGRIRSRVTTGRDASSVPSERSNVSNMQPSTILSDSNTPSIQAEDTDAVALETQHEDPDAPEEQVTDHISLGPRSDNSSIPKVQTEALGVADLMQHVEPDLMRKFRRFRILIIGRANAGKTTILQRICNSTEEPEVYNDQGEKVRFTKLGYVGC